MGNPPLFSGFTPIPIIYSPNTTHYIYARSHTATKKNAIFPTGRTLFLVNISPDATERDLIQLFRNSGTVEKVVFGTDIPDEFALIPDSDDEGDGEKSDNDKDGMEVDGEKPSSKRRRLTKEAIPKVTPLPSAAPPTLRKTGGSAHLVFLDSSSHDRAVNSLSNTRPWPATEEPCLSRYLAYYNSLRPPLDAIRQHADTYIEVYEYNLAKERQKSRYKKGEAIVDEDGFTLVTRGGAYGQTLGGGVAVASKKFQQSGKTRSRTKKEKKEKQGFYAFQKAEKQRKEILDLKRKWEEDKAKVEKLKASRRFKPY